jgi:hypothetical protein
MKGMKNRKILFMARKQQALSLETIYDILWEIEIGSKTKTEIAMDFQIPKSTLSGIVSKREINDYFFLIKMTNDGEQSVPYM